MSASAPIGSSSAAAPSSADPSTAGNIATAQGGSGEVTAASTVSSLADLKNKAPKVYDMMMLGIAMSMVNKMHHQDERLKQLWREARYNS